MGKEQEIRWLLEEKYKGKLTSQAKKDIARLKKGEHPDYVIGWVPFLDCRIDLRYKPLIPRTETEYWVEEVISNLKSQNSKLSCLDMFAGSGCIGIAVLKHIPFARVDFAEKEKEPCKQIVLNAKLNKIGKSRYRAIQSDMFSKIKGHRYDYIFANPPYLAESRKEKIQKSVLEQEPHAALFGGKDGLKYIRRFLGLAKEFLNKNGVIYLEFDSFQKPAIEKLLKKLKYKKWAFHKDQYNKWRFVNILGRT